MNYNAQVLSNTFKVKDVKLVSRLLQSAGFYTDVYEDSICFYDNEDGAYLCDMEVVYYNDIPVTVSTDYNDDQDIYDAITEQLGIEEKDIHLSLMTKQDLFDFLQEQLLDKEYVMVTEVGHEGLRYQGACGVVITKKSIKWIDLNRALEQVAEQDYKE